MNQANYAGADEGRYIFETLSESYTVLSLFEGLRGSSGGGFRLPAQTGRRTTSGGSALVSMVQAADLRKRDNPTDVRSLNWARLRRILLQSEVRSAVVIQVDNATPIVPSLEKSVTRGIRG